VIAAAIVLTGCASLPPAQAFRPDAQAMSNRPLERCEAVIYRAAASEADTALRCASVVGVWQ
jgi:uncharacterized lipoprotein YajG